MVSFFGVLVAVSVACITALPIDGVHEVEKLTSEQMESMVIQPSSMPLAVDPKPAPPSLIVKEKPVPVPAPVPAPAPAPVLVAAPLPLPVIQVTEQSTQTVEKLPIPEDKPVASPSPAALQQVPQTSTPLDLIIVIPTVRRFQSDGSLAPERLVTL
jgi:hypothetical protein